MASQEELDRARELRDIENDRVGISGEVLDNLRSASNVVSDTVSKLKFEKQERSDIRSITRELNKVAKDNYSLSLNELGSSKNLAKLQKDQVNLQKQILQASKLRDQFSKSLIESEFDLSVALESQVIEAQKLSAQLAIIEEESLKIAQNMGVKGFAVAEDIVGAIPGLRQFKGTFSEAANSARSIAAAGGSSAEAFAAGAKSLLSAAKSAIPLLLLNELFKSLSFLDESSGKLAKNLGISYDEALGLTQELYESSIQSNNIFINTSNLIDSQLQLSNALGTNAKLSNDILVTQTELTKMAGYSVEAANQLSILSLATGKSTEDITTQFLGQAKALNINNKLSLNEKQLLESIAKTSKGTLATFASQPKELAKAIFAAKKLGLEISQVEKIADGLLDIESSLTAEFEAEVISGRQLNLERARFFALTNDLAGVSEELGKQGITQASFAKSSRIEQQAVAAAMGMSRDELGEMLLTQNALTAIGAKDAEAAREKFEMLKAQGGEAYAIANLGDETYAQQLASVSNQEKFLELTNKLRDAFVSIAGPLMEIITPIVTILAPVLSGISQVVGFLAKSFSGIPGVLAGMIPLLLKASFIAKSFALLGFKGAIAAIFRSFASIPFGLGIPLAIGAVGGLATLIKSASTQIGDGIFPADGKTQISTKEGGLFEVSKNDDVIAAPNLLGQNRSPRNPQPSGTTNVTVTLSKTDIQAIANAVKEGASQANINVNLDGNRVSNNIQTPLAVNTRRYSV